MPYFLPLLSLPPSLFIYISFSLGFYSDWHHITISLASRINYDAFGKHVFFFSFFFFVFSSWTIGYAASGYGSSGRGQLSTGAQDFDEGMDAGRCAKGLSGLNDVGG